MKLELKHLASYLPYGLNIGSFDNVLTCIDVDSNTVWTKFRGHLNNQYKIEDVKPILHPLSDLTKEIEINGEKFVPIRKLEELFPCVEFYNDDELSYLFSDTDCRGEFFHSIELILTLEISNKLFEWHFDVFNLRENDLCIYYNEL